MPTVALGTKTEDELGGCEEDSSGQREGEGCEERQKTIRLCTHAHPQEVERPRRPPPVHYASVNHPQDYGLVCWLVRWSGQCCDFNTGTLET